MIGVTLIAEGFHFNIPKGYIYFSMAFAFFVDMIQLKTTKRNFSYNLSFVKKYCQLYI